MLLQVKLLCSRHYGFSIRNTLLSSFNRFFSAGKSIPDCHFAQRYLVKSCGFSPKQAIKLAKKADFLDCSSNPDLVIQFLKENDLSDIHIRAVLAHDPRILSFDVDKTLKPWISELEELGFTASHRARFLTLYPLVKQCGFWREDIKFWIPILGSVENLLILLKKIPGIFMRNSDKVVLVNLSFLQESCGLSVCQIVSTCSWLLTENPPKVKEIVERAKNLEIPCKSGRFKDALSSSVQNSSKIEGKFEFFKSFGWSEEEISSMIKKQPRLLKNTTENLNRTINFLIREVGLDSNFVMRHPVILMLSMDKRLLPRHLVMKILDSLKLPEGKRSYFCAVLLTENKFIEKFIFPNEGARPGLGKIYASACRVKKRGYDEKSRLLEKVGFCEQEIKFMMSKIPKSLPKSEEKMRKFIDFVVNECGLDLSYLACHPRILTCSLERNLIPRHYVLKSLEFNGLLTKRSFLTVVKMNEINFLKKYVSPYEDKIPGLAETYAAFSSEKVSVNENK